MSGPLLYEPERLAAHLEAAGLDALVAVTAPNVLWLTRFRKPGAIAVVTRAEPARPTLLLASPDADFLVEDLADGVEPVAYGTFYRHRDEGAELTAAERLVERVSGAARDADPAGLLAELLPGGARVAADVACGPVADASHEPGVFRALRSVKTAEEVRRLREAARIAEQAIEETVAVARAGVTQRELARAFSAAVAASGAKVRLDNVSVGRTTALGNANVPDEVLADPGLVRFDVGAVWEGYASDLSRCFALGDPPEKARRYHAALLAGQRAALDRVRPGVRAAEVFEAGVRGVREAGIPHYERTNVGHGIGVAGDGYDAPLLAPGSDAVLEAGMVLCVETPYYELGFAGLQVEDMVHVTADGWEPLSTLPGELVGIG